MIRVYEDNGGGLHMTDGEIVVSGIECQPEPGGLVEDIVAFEEWQSDATERLPYTDMEAGLEHETTQLIATWDRATLTLHADRMGAAGLRYAGIDSVYLD